MSSVIFDSNSFLARYPEFSAVTPAQLQEYFNEATLYLSNGTAYPAVLQSGMLAGMTLVQLQALSGTLIVTVNGVQFTSSAINFAGATSFTNAASLIAEAFGGVGAPCCAWNAGQSAFVLTSPTSGATATIAYASGSLAASLKLDQADGAILTQGSEQDSSPVQDLNRRAVLLNMLTAHVACLAGALGNGQARPVGRVSNASKGSISTGLEYIQPGTHSWFTQTQYGAAFWQATASLRGFSYIPNPTRF